MTTEHDPSPLDVIEQHDGQGGYQLRLTGEVDLSSLPALRVHVDRIIADPPARVGFDLSGVSFMDSSGIGVLLEVAHAVPAVVLVNPSPAVARLVELCGLSSVLPTAPPLPVTS